MSADLRAPRPSDEGGPADAAAAVVTAAAAYVRGLIELAAVEARLAALSGAWMLVLVIVAAALLVLTWAILAGVVGYLLVAAGLSWPLAGLLLAAVHAAGAYFSWRAIVRLSRSLTLPQLRRAVLSADE